MDATTHPARPAALPPRPAPPEASAFGWSGLLPLERRLLMDAVPGVGGPGGLGGLGEAGGPIAATGVQQALLVRVVFSDQRGNPLDPVFNDAEVREQLGRVAEAFDRSSYGQLSLTDFDLTPVLTLPGRQQDYAAAADGIGRLREDALAAAAAAGFEPGTYWNDAVWFPTTKFANDAFEFFGGLANLDARGTWLNGTIDAFVIAHEFGHNLGLRHGSALDTTPGSPPEPVPSRGDVLVYGDPYGLMGSGDVDDGFAAYARASLGWLPTNTVRAVGSDGVYRVYELDTADAPAREATRLLSVDGTPGGDPLALDQDRLLLSYTPSYDRRSGVDDTGLRVFRAVDLGDARTLLLDPLPGSAAGAADFEDAFLPAGQALYDPLNGLELEVVGSGRDADGAYLEVRIDTGVGPGIRPDRFEDNDRRSEAGTLLTSNGDAFEAALTVDRPGDEDWFQYTAAESGEAVFRLEFAQAFGDLDLEAYDRDGGYLDAARSRSDNESLPLTLDAGETVLLRVFGVGGQTAPAYNLKVEGVLPRSDTFEPNNTVATAPLLYVTGGRPNGQVSANLTTSTEPGSGRGLPETRGGGDVDFYRYDLVAGDRLRLRLETGLQAVRDGDVQIEVLGPEGEVLAGDYGDGPESGLSLLAVRTGSYWVQVYAASAAQGQRYVLDWVVDPPGTLEGGTTQPLNDSYELNNDPESAFLLEPKRSLIELGAPARVDLADWYRFAPAGPGRLTVRVDEASPRGGPGDTLRVELFDPAGNLLTRAEGGGPSLEVSTDVTGSPGGTLVLVTPRQPDSRLAYDLVGFFEPAPLAVDDAADAPGRGDGGSRAPGPGPGPGLDSDPFEPNNVNRSPTVLPVLRPGEPLRLRDLVPGGVPRPALASDLDVFRLTLAEPGGVEVRFDTADGGVFERLSVSLVEAGGMPVAFERAGRTLSAAGLAAGAYLLRVEPAAPGSGVAVRSERYGFEAEAIEGRSSGDPVPKLEGRLKYSGLASAPVGLLPQRSGRRG